MAKTRHRSRDQRGGVDSFHRLNQPCSHALSRKECSGRTKKSHALFNPPASKNAHACCDVSALPPCGVWKW